MVDTAYTVEKSVHWGVVVHIQASLVQSIKHETVAGRSSYIICI
jgi:hypothetical protein